MKAQLFCGLLILCLVGCERETRAPSVSWEYLVIDLDGLFKHSSQKAAHRDNCMENLGRDGWELVAIEPGIHLRVAYRDQNEDQYFPDRTLYYFKRPSKK